MSRVVCYGCDGCRNRKRNLWWGGDDVRETHCFSVVVRSWCFEYCMALMMQFET